MSYGDSTASLGNRYVGAASENRLRPGAKTKMMGLRPTPHSLSGTLTGNPGSTNEWRIYRLKLPHWKEIFR